MSITGTATTATGCSPFTTAATGIERRNHSIHPVLSRNHGPPKTISPATRFPEELPPKARSTDGQTEPRSARSLRQKLGLCRFCSEGLFASPEATCGRGCAISASASQPRFTLFVDPRQHRSWTPRKLSRMLLSFLLLVVSDASLVSRRPWSLSSAFSLRRWWRPAHPAPHGISQRLRCLTRGRPSSWCGR